MTALLFTQVYNYLLIKRACAVEVVPKKRQAEDKGLVPILFHYSWSLVIYHSLLPTVSLCGGGHLCKKAEVFTKKQQEKLGKKIFTE